MTDNRWQYGVYGNHESADDETVRQYIEAVKRENHCSGSEAIKIITQIAYAHINEPEPIRELAAYIPDNSEVLAAIAALSRKIDRLSMGQPANEAHKLPETMKDTPVEWESIDPDDKTPFLRGIVNGARPGMRLDDAESSSRGES